MELFLFDALPRVNTNPIAHRLIGRFGSLDGVFSASEDELLEVQGVGKRTAEYILRAHREFSDRTESEMTSRPMSSFEHASNYLIWHRRNERVPQDAFTVIMTDSDMNFSAVRDIVGLTQPILSELCAQTGAERVILGVGSMNVNVSHLLDEKSPFEICDIISINGFNAESIMPEDGEK